MEKAVTENEKTTMTVRCNREQSQSRGGAKFTGEAGALLDEGETKISFSLSVVKESLQVA